LEDMMLANLREIYQTGQLAWPYVIT